MPTINPGDDAAVTGSGGSATVNHDGFVITTESLSTASGSDATYTVFNNNIVSGGLLFITLGNGTNTTVPVYAHSVQTSAGSATMKIRNANAASALNGTVLIGGFVA